MQNAAPGDSCTLQLSADTASASFVLDEAVEIDGNCVGARWTAHDEERLARVIAIVGMGQAFHAAEIVKGLKPNQPAFTYISLKDAAKRNLTITGDPNDPNNPSRWIRDGFLFEVISWIVTKQAAGPVTFLKDPHIKATTQGLDGLILQLNDAKSELIQVTICEDKCTSDPRKMFKDAVIPAFKLHHENKRAPELIAAAAALLKEGGVTGETATKAAERVLNLQFRSYLAALTASQEHDSVEGRQKLFKDFEDLSGIEKAQRIGATFIVSSELRAWFDSLATKAIEAIDSFQLTGS